MSASNLRPKSSKRRSHSPAIRLTQPKEHPVATACSPVGLAKIIHLPVNHDHRGNLTFLQNGSLLPFDIQRIYWLYDVPGGETRAGHALKTTHQLLVAVAGSFSVRIDDGLDKQTFFLNRSHSALYLPPYVWRVIDDFSSGAVCLSIVSSHYDPDDYYRDYSEFLSRDRCVAF